MTFAMNLLVQIVGWIGVPFVIYCAYLFLGKPFSRFFDIRIDVAEKLAEYDNVTQLELDRAKEAQAIFRKLGTQLLALAGNHRMAVSILKMRLFRYDPGLAGRESIGLSNSLDPPQEIVHHKQAHKRQITTALRLLDE